MIPLGVGPVAVAVDTDGTVYVAQFEVKGGSTTDGKVYVLTAGGKLEGEIVVEGTHYIHTWTNMIDGVYCSLHLTAYV